MRTEKRRKFIIDVTYWVLVLAIVYFIFKYLLNLVMPFFIAFTIAFLLQPVIRLLRDKCRFPGKLAAVVSVILFYATVGVLIALVGAKLFSWLRDLFLSLPTLYTQSILPALQNFSATVTDIFNNLDPEVVTTVNTVLTDLISALGNIFSNLSVKAVGFVSGAAGSLPGIVIGMLITIISTFFITADYSNITGFIMLQLGEKSRHLVLEVKRYTVEILGKYLRSYLLIMCITFAELSVGLLILGVKNAFLVALGIAIFDILPVFGTGGIMIPWAVISLLSGDYKLAIGLLVVYVVITVIRNIIEPRIVGQSVGLHPVVTLLSMFVGTALFGVIGLFGLPITMALLVSLNDSGVIHLFKKKEENRTEG